jgi:transposase
LKAAVISDEVYVEIELLKKRGFSLRKIADEVGCAVNTVRRHLAEEGLPRYERKKQAVTKLSRFEGYLRERQAAGRPAWIPATVLQREIAALGYAGGASQLRAFMHELKPTLPMEPVMRFETAAGEQMQVDWVEFRKGRDPLYAFCATLGFSRASFVQFVADMKVHTLIECHERAFECFGGIPLQVLYDNMKTVVLERDVSGGSEHRFHAGFLDYARHCGFVIRLCRPYRAKTKGKVERFNGYLRRSFYVPLAAQLKQAGLTLDVSTANAQVHRWLKDVANERIHGTTQVAPAARLRDERLQPIPAPWRGDICAARPQLKCERPRPAAVIERIAQGTPVQHPLSVYERLFEQIRDEMQEPA